MLMNETKREAEKMMDDYLLFNGWQITEDEYQKVKTHLLRYEGTEEMYEEMVCELHSIMDSRVRP